MSDLFTPQQIQPIKPTNFFDLMYQEPQSTGNQLLQGLYSMTLQPNADGYGQLAGLPGYGGQLYPNINQTILPSVYGAWTPNNPGTDYLGSFIGNPNAGSMAPAFQNAMSNMYQYGGLGGYPTQLMSGMAQYGGTGGLGNRQMSSQAQFGVPSAAGQGLVNMANTGVSGSWGGPLYNRATGGPTAAMNFLAPFLQAKPYQAGWGGR